MAALSFESARGHFAPAAQHREGELPVGVMPSLATHNGVTFLLPYFEQGAKLQQIDLRWDWDDTTRSRNELATKQDLGGILICPSSPVIQTSRHSNDYCAANRVDIVKLAPLVTANLLDSKNKLDPFDRAWDSALQYDFLSLNEPEETDRRRTRAAEVADGLSNTALYMESVGKPFMFGWYRRSKDPAPKYYNGEEILDDGALARSVNSKFRWASPLTWMTINNFCHGSQIINCNNVSQPYGFHPGGILISFADGRVEFAREEVDPNAFVAWITMSGGETVR